MDKIYDGSDKNQCGKTNIGSYNFFVSVDNALVYAAAPAKSSGFSSSTNRLSPAFLI